MFSFCEDSFYYNNILPVYSSDFCTEAQLEFLKYITKKWFYTCFTTTDGRNFKKKTPIIISMDCNSENNVNFSKVIVEPHCTEI
ncbi:UNVERIFIED_CONTAM: hypothetical protein NCL1_45835 [Trichonephila clavipes]